MGFPCVDRWCWGLVSLTNQTGKFACASWAVMSSHTANALFFKCLHCHTVKKKKSSLWKAVLKEITNVGGLTSVYIFKNDLCVVLDVALFTTAFLDCACNHCETLFCCLHCKCMWTHACITCTALHACYLCATYVAVQVQSVLFVNIWIEYSPQVVFLHTGGPFQWEEIKVTYALNSILFFYHFATLLFWVSINGYSDPRKKVFPAQNRSVS